MVWNDCLEKNDAIKSQRDIGKAKSLIEMAQDRISFFDNIEKKNYNVMFENLYSSLIEYLHAIIIMDGYKVKNHVCLGHYIREIMKREDLFNLFDDCRFKRNSLVYYGNQMEKEIALESVRRIKRLIDDIKAFLPNVKF